MNSPKRLVPVNESVTPVPTLGVSPRLSPLAHTLCTLLEHGRNMSWRYLTAGLEGKAVELECGVTN